MPIQWSEKHSVNVKEIDDQHKSFIETLNALYASVYASEPREKMGEILENLISYAENHFATEEKYFDLYQYENSTEHKEEHRKMKEKLADFQVKFKDGSADVTLDLMDFLENWLVDHLENQDHKYIDCFKRNGLA